MICVFSGTSSAQITPEILHTIGTAPVPVISKMILELWLILGLDIQCLIPFQTPVELELLGVG